MSTSEALRQQVQDYLVRQPNAMTMVIARDLQVPEAEVVAALPAEQVTPLAVERFEEMMHRLEAMGQVHVIVSNGATTLEAFGRFGNFSVWGEYFNVQTKSLDMHIRRNELASAFAVQKPSHLDGVPTLSIQFFDQRGSSAFKVFLTFGGSAPSEEKSAAWRAFRDEFRRP